MKEYRALTDSQIFLGIPDDICLVADSIAVGVKRKHDE